MFECVESKFSFDRCLRQESVEAPRWPCSYWQTWKKYGSGKEWEFFWTQETLDLQLHMGRQLLDHVPFQESLRTDAEGSDLGS